MLALLGLLGIALAAGALADIVLRSDDADADDMETAGDADEVTIQRVDDILDVADSAGAGSDSPDDSDVSIELNDAPGGQPGDVITPDPSDDDPFVGDDGNDLAYGGDGFDILQGGGGDDELHGGRGDDLIDGGFGDDQLWGHVGDDQLFGGQGSDMLNGGDGNDLLNGGDNADTLLGSYGDDTLIGGEGADLMKGGAGNDLLDGTGDQGSDMMNGGAGDDVLRAGAGDQLHGGSGNDLFALGAGPGVTIADYDAATDMIEITYDGTAPTLRSEVDADGLTLFADDAPVAYLDGIATLDLAQVRLVDASAGSAAS